MLEFRSIARSHCFHSRRPGDSVVKFRFRFKNSNEKWRSRLNILNPVTVVLADDHAMVRQSLARVLDMSGEVNVVGQTGDGAEIRDLVQRHRPECLVMDYSMPNHEPVELIKELAGESKSVKIVVLTVHENIHYAVRTLRAGANGYLIKSSAVEELVEAIHAVRRGETFVSKKIAGDVLDLMRRPYGERGGLAALSQREFEVLQMLGRGASLQECSKALNVTVSTVSTYRSRILEKLELKTTSELVRFAIENNIG